MRYYRCPSATCPDSAPGAVRGIGGPSRGPHRCATCGSTMRRCRRNGGPLAPRSARRFGIVAWYPVPTPAPRREDSYDGPRAPFPLFPSDPMRERFWTGD